MAKPKPKQTLDLPQMDEAQVLQSTIERWRKDFVAFFREALNATPTNQQIEVLEAFQAIVAAKTKAGTKQRMTDAEKELAKKIGVTIHSGKGTGKDFFAAGLAIMFLFLFSPFKGICTASNRPQLEDVLSTQIRRLLLNAHPVIQDSFLVDQAGIYLKKGNGKKGEDFMSKRTASVRGDSEASGQSMAGYHEVYMLNIIDEASDVPDPIIQKLEETCTGFCNLVLMIGNVTRAHGAFYRSRYDPEYSKLYWGFRWNAEDSNLDDIMPGLKAQNERYLLMGNNDRNSNVYRVCVLGLAPAEEADALIPWAWIIEAQDRWSTMETDVDVDPTILGVDVGAGGDDSAICRRVGGKAVSNVARSTKDTNVLAEWLNEQMEIYEPDMTVVDNNGLGRSFCDAFRKWYGREIIELNVGTGTSYKGKYHRLRDEIWIDRVRVAFEKGQIAIDPKDQDLAMELAALKVEDWYREPLKVVSKKKMKAAGLRSPNKADALMHTYALAGAAGAERIHEQRDRYRSEEPARVGWMAV